MAAPPACFVANTSGLAKTRLSRGSSTEDFRYLRCGPPTTLVREFDGAKWFGAVDITGRKRASHVTRFSSLGQID
jgi:hypothetical protein